MMRIRTSINQTIGASVRCRAMESKPLPLPVLSPVSVASVCPYAAGVATYGTLAALPTAIQIIDSDMKNVYSAPESRVVLLFEDAVIAASGNSGCSNWEYF